MQKHAGFSLISRNQLLEMDLALKYRTIPFFVWFILIFVLKISRGCYNIMWSSLSVTCGRSVVFSGYSGLLHQKKTDCHYITGILLKVALNTMTLTLWKLTVKLPGKIILYATFSESVYIYLQCARNPSHHAFFLPSFYEVFFRP